MLQLELERGQAGFGFALFPCSLQEFKKRSDEMSKKVVESCPFAEYGVVVQVFISASLLQSLIFGAGCGPWWRGLFKGESCKL